MSMSYGTGIAIILYYLALPKVRRAQCHGGDNEYRIRDTTA